jgi:hypothetical protein
MMWKSLAFGVFVLFYCDRGSAVFPEVGTAMTASQVLPPYLIIPYPLKRRVLRCSNFAFFTAIPA